MKLVDLLIIVLVILVLVYGFSDTKKGIISRTEKAVTKIDRWLDD